MNRIELYHNLVFALIERFQIDPEVAHERVLQLLELGQSLPLGLAAIKLLTQVNGFNSAVVDRHVRAGNLVFDNPVVLAEGFDKDLQVVQALLALGFGGYIGGTITEWPQLPNPGKILQRLSDGSLLNYHGLDNEGVDAAVQRLSSIRERTIFSQPIGVSIGANRWIDTEDMPEAHARVARRLSSLADFLVVNVASPNTQGLRDNLAYSRLSRIVEAVQNAVLDTDVYVKLSPDMTMRQVEEFLQVCLEQAVTGVVAVNTSINPELKRQLGLDPQAPGGLSGTIIRDLALSAVRFVRAHNPELVIIGEGGVDSPQAAQAMLAAGADLIGIFSGLVFQGPSLPSFLAREMS